MFEDLSNLEGHPCFRGSLKVRGAPPNQREILHNDSHFMKDSRLLCMRYPAIPRLKSWQRSVDAMSSPREQRRPRGNVNYRQIWGTRAGSPLQSVQRACNGHRRRLWSVQQPRKKSPCTSARSRRDAMSGFLSSRHFLVCGIPFACDICDILRSCDCEGRHAWYIPYFFDRSKG